jgi:DNA-binding transcriptional LysR family regulator
MDIKRADLPLLISLDILLEEKNVTKAAQRLHISQPALSTQLARLRTLFNDPLLVPAEIGRGMVLTERASNIQEKLRASINDLKFAVNFQTSFDPATSRRKFTIATNDSVFTILGLPVLKKILSFNNPGLQTSFISVFGLNLKEDLEMGKVDLYIGDINKMPDSLKVKYLMKDDFVMAQKKAHPRTTKKPTLSEYCQLSHVIVTAKGDLSSSIDHLLSEQSLTRHIVASVPSYNQIALVLSNSDCVATLPKQLLEKYEDQLDLIQLPFSIPPFELGMAWHTKLQDDEALTWLRQQFIES